MNNLKIVVTLIWAVVILIIRINMGCGAICGDSLAQTPTTRYRQPHQTMQLLISSLTKTSPLASKPALSNFITLYNQNPQTFHLPPKSQLTTADEVSSDVLTKWKLILYGLDSGQQKYSDCLGLQQSEGEQHSNLPQHTILHHSCFGQIQKDIDRTMSLPMGRKGDFQNTLKRIANFFPKMGYTQGLNFIIGYLIIIGYSEDDCFWIFVHLAINRRYLLLGLYQDGFPLSNTLIILFKNILKRNNHALYQHMFQTLCIDPSTWIFKWFTTCFIYSFPLELVHYVWDVMIQLGSIGLVTFAVNVALQLRPYLMQQEDLADASQFMQSLKNLEVVNHYLNVEVAVKAAFQMEVRYEDFQGVEEFGGFYGAYFKEKYKEKLNNQIQTSSVLPKYDQSNPKSQELLDEWYQKLSEERQEFMRNNKTAITLDMPLLIESNQKSIKHSESGQLQVISSHNIRDLKNSQQPKTRKASCDINKNQLQIHRKRVQLLFDKINEKLEQESRSNKSRRSRVSRQTRKSHQNNYGQNKQPKSIRQSVSIREAGVLDELDKLEQEFDVKSKKSVIINNYASHQQTPKTKEVLPCSHYGTNLTVKVPPAVKINKDSTFGLAAKNALKLQNCDVSSVISKQLSSHSKLKASNISVQGQLSPSKIGRSCACKTKTQQNKLSASQLASQKDQFSDKDSMSNRNLSHSEQPIDDLKSACGEKAQNHRERLTTVADYMINSHGPALKEKQALQLGGQHLAKNAETDHQVVVLPFKKIKKQKEGVSNILISKRQPPSDLVRLHLQHEQESLESVHPYSTDKAIEHSCEIESVR